MNSRLLLLVGLTACVKTTATRPLPLPQPLPAPEFRLPPTETRTLSNGLQVVVATNHEVPTWQMDLLFDTGGYANPKGKEGLASATFSMLSRGAGGMSAGEIDREFRKLGGSIAAGSDTDGALVSVHGLSAQLEPTLDLWAKVLLHPDFPTNEWDILRANWKADLTSKREDPGTIAGRAMSRLQYGDAYRGSQASEASYDAIATTDLAKFYQDTTGPKSAILLVGGDITADQVVPLLEARLSGWTSAGAPPAVPEVSVKPAQPSTLFLIDKPGASQSVVRIFTSAARPSEPGFHAAHVANEAFGGSFTGRVNLNLREDKGYTYGARCFFQTRFGPSLWYCGANVQAEVTSKALVEFRNEIQGALGDRPLSEEEISRYREAEIYGFPAPFETTDALLQSEANVRRYDLPADWLVSYIPKLNEVTTEQANAAFRSRVREDGLSWLVVGDAAKIRPELETLGFTIVSLDRDGNPVETK